MRTNPIPYAMECVQIYSICNGMPTNLLHMTLMEVKGLHEY